MTVSNWQRWLFWLILGAFSVFFAEVLATSDPYVFFHFFGLLGVFPHYTLHVLVLAPLVIRLDRKVRFGALFLAGTLFGLYEAYMTKVLWSPPWDPDAIRIGGVAVMTSAMLVLFWHPFFSFLLPLFVADHLLLDSDRLQFSLPGTYSAPAAKALVCARGSYCGRNVAWFSPGRTGQCVSFGGFDQRRRFDAVVPLGSRYRCAAV